VWKAEGQQGIHNGGIIQNTLSKHYTSEMAAIGEFQ